MLGVSGETLGISSLGFRGKSGSHCNDSCSESEL